MTGQLGQRRRRAAEADIEQLDQRVPLALGQLHGDVPFKTCSTVCTI